MRMAEARDGDARTEIEIFRAVLRIESHALAVIEGQRRALIGRKYWRYHRVGPNENAATNGGSAGLLIWVPLPRVNHARPKIGVDNYPPESNRRMDRGFSGL